MKKSFRSNSIIWIDIALSDLKSSEELYKLRHYRTSFFFFQQASEKATKALGIYMGHLLTTQDVLKLQHNPLKFYRRLAVQSKAGLETKIDQLKIVPSKVQKEYTEMQQGLEELDKLYNKNMLNVTSSDINSALKQIEMANRLVRKDYKKVISEVRRKSPLGVPFVVYLLQYLYDFAFIGITFAVCAVFTFKEHAELTRYPKNGQNPDYIYRKNLPLIRKQPLLMQCLKEALMRLKRDQTKKVQKLLERMGNSKVKKQLN